MTFPLKRVALIVVKVFVMVIVTRMATVLIPEFEYDMGPKTPIDIASPQDLSPERFARSTFVTVHGRGDFKKAFVYARYGVPYTYFLLEGYGPTLVVRTGEEVTVSDNWVVPLNPSRLRILVPQADGKSPTFLDTLMPLDPRNTDAQGRSMTGESVLFYPYLPSIPEPVANDWKRLDRHVGRIRSSIAFSRTVRAVFKDRFDVEIPADALFLTRDDAPQLSAWQVAAAIFAGILWLVLIYLFFVHPVIRRRRRARAAAPAPA